MSDSSPKRPLPAFFVAALFLALSLFPAPSLWADEVELGSADKAELSFVSVDGNSKSSSFSLRNTYTYTWQNAVFKLEAGALRAETSSIARRGRLLDDGTVEVVKTSTSELTAENYFLRGRFDATINPNLYYFVGSGWERNEFAGIANRYGAVAGLGHIWSASETFKFKTDLGLTFTREEAVAAPNTDDFVGLRAGYDLTKVLTKTTTWTSTLFLDGNFDDTSDYRADWTNGLAVVMTERLQLKATLQLLYDHQPGFVRVPVDLPPGVTSPRFFVAQLDEIDSIFSVALVISF